MRAPSYSTQFRRDVKRVEKRGYDMGKLRAVLQLLMDGSPLPARLKDHALKGNWKGWRDLHIEPDWVLIYWADGAQVRFERCGTHADLFDT